MAFQVQGENGTIQQVGGPLLRAGHVHVKPIEYVVGHYRTVVRLAMVPSQAANSRLFEIRNTGNNLLIPTRLEVTVLPSGPIATPYLLELAAYKYTGFTAVDTTSTATPTAGVARTGMAAYPGNAHIRVLTPAGAAAGMTGGTLGTKAGNPLGLLLAWLASVSANSQPVTRGLLGDVSNGAYPMMFGEDEGFVIEQVPAGSATANAVAVLVDLAWCEAQAY